MRFLLGHLEQEWEDPRWIAYGLATARHETGADFRCRLEWASKTDPEFLRYETGPLGKVLGNTQPGDGKRYRGRCFVQLTGRANYAKMDRALGIDMLANPDLCLQPDVACKVMSTGMRLGMFTGRKLADFFPEKGVADAINARRIINGMDRAELIAGYYREFLNALMANVLTDQQIKEAV